MLDPLVRSGTFSLFVAMGLASATAAAQSPNDDLADSRDSSGEAKKGNSPRSSEGDAKKREPRSQNDRAERRTDRYVPGGREVPGRMNEAFSFPAPNGCQYSSTIRGTVRSARTAAGEEPKYTPNLVVNAWVTCQNNTDIRVTDNTLREAPMTRVELEQAIELRGTLLSEASGKRCVFVPDFALGDSRLASIGVSYLCPPTGNVASAQDEARTDGQRAQAINEERSPYEGRAEGEPKGRAREGRPEGRSSRDGHANDTKGEGRFSPDDGE
ncbi:MAG TPA: hypothetical protein VJT73_08430 [Polyangiaceae bacterium]|nr:hypothetical protein [Polyangiaceae bacterium]